MILAPNHPGHRIETALLLAMLGVLVALPAEAARRVGARDGPAGKWCPYYDDVDFFSDPIQRSPGGGLVFTAVAATARVTFQSCDEGRDLTFPQAAVDLRLTDVSVVRKDIWNNYFHVGLPSYEGPGCYNDFTVTSRFDRDTAASEGAPVVFRETFAGTPDPRWEFHEADVLSGAACGTGFPANRGCLVLAVASRAGTPSDQTYGRCASATLIVDGLVAGTDYVVDFDWWAGATLPIPGGGLYYAPLEVLLQDDVK